MDPNPDILEQESGSPAVATGADGAAATREWPGVSEEKVARTPEGAVKFPGEDGGASLGRMAEKDLEAALRLLAERAQYITGASGAAIALRDGDEMVCRASAGGSAPEIGARLQMDSGLSGESIRTRTMLHCADTQMDSRVNRETCEALGIASVVIMPMLDGGEVVGVFELFSDRANAFEDRDILALDRMSAMVKTAIEEANGAKNFSGEEEVLESAAAEVVEIQQVEAEQAASCTAPSDALPEVSAMPGLPAEAGEQADQVPDAEATPVMEPAAVEPEIVDTDEVSSAGLAGTAADNATTAESETESVRTDSADAVFLTTPEAEQLAETEPTAAASSGKLEPTDEEHETESGEMARDAAARTAAFKASLFEREADAIEREVKASRIAFHMPAPKKKPVEPEPAVAQTGSRDEAKDVANQAPLEIGEEVSVPEAASRHDDFAEQATTRQVAVSAVPEFQAVDNVAADEPIAASLQAVPSVQASIGFAAAAAAPAREAAVEEAKSEPVKEVAESIAENYVAAAANVEVSPSAGVEGQATPATNADHVAKKPEVVRPASPEGRAKIAVLQVRKCETCGFPVSEGRKLCLDCEKKNASAAAKAASAEASSKSAARDLKGGATQAKAEAVQIEAASHATTNVAKTDTPSAKEEPPSNADGPAESKVENAGTATSSHVTEAPMPKFMVESPDRYESWIVAHMYWVVGIAVIVIGAVVYLLSR